MKGQIESLLERGIEAARSKEKKRARDFLINVIELDQSNEKAWLWLSSVAETPADKEVCLENVLTINPDNTYAAMGLQHLRRQPQDQLGPPSLLPRLIHPQPSTEWEWDVSTEKPGPPPAERVCPSCGFRNPGWAYLCDQCGANVRRVNLRQTVRDEVARSRGRSFATLFEAWGSAFVFNRLWAFGPELELASWGRSLAALGLAPLSAAVWRAAMSLLLYLMAGGGWNTQVAINALGSMRQALPPTLLLMLFSLPIALFTWVVAHVAGGRQSFKIHLHLTTVAFSAWIALAALLTPFTVLLPRLLGGGTRSDPVATFVTIAMSATGPIWLTQAIRTAQGFSYARAILATLLVAVVGAILFFVLQAVTGGGFADFMSKLAVAPFLPLPDLGS